MNNENNNLGNQIPNNNQNVNMENNTGFNPATQQFQQPMNQQPVNNNQMGNSYNQNNMNQQQPQMNNINPATQQFQQPMNQQFQQPMNQQPVYQNQPYTNNNVPTNKKGNNGKLFIFLGIGIAIFIAIVVLVIVLFAGNDKNNNTNEYEEDNNINNNISEQPTDKQDIYSYKGFDFNKVSGYIYGEDDGLLTIQNNSYGMLLTISQVTFNNVKANYNLVTSQFTETGYTVGQTKIDTYSNVEVITYELSKGGQNGLYFVVASPNVSYIYEGLLINKNNTIDYSNINELIKVSNNSKYSGNYSDYSSSFGGNFDLNSIAK